MLPFSNLSDNPGQQYFSDGITDDIITELSRFRSLLVIARQSCFAFRGTQLTVPQIAAKLGVAYIVEGSVRRSGDRVRINAQLVDAALGSQLWASISSELEETKRQALPPSHRVLGRSRSASTSPPRAKAAVSANRRREASTACSRGPLQRERWRELVEAQVAQLIGTVWCVAAPGVIAGQVDVVPGQRPDV